MEIYITLLFYFFMIAICKFLVEEIKIYLQKNLKKERKRKKQNRSYTTEHRGGSRKQ